MLHLCVTYKAGAAKSATFKSLMRLKAIGGWLNHADIKSKVLQVTHF
jgi:hypothetical protein